MSASENEVLRDEYQRMVVRLQQARNRSEKLRVLADAADAQVAADEKLLRALGELLGTSSQATLEDLNTRLRGQRLREVAVDVLRVRLSEGQAIHYREWFELLREEGFAVAGKDPLATFLAQISRAADVEALGKRSGRYRLRAVA